MRIVANPSCVCLAVVAALLLQSPLLVLCHEGDGLQWSTAVVAKVMSPSFFGSLSVLPGMSPLKVPPNNTTDSVVIETTTIPRARYSIGDMSCSQRTVGATSARCAARLGLQALSIDEVRPARM